jgi:hypothetical protein
MTKHSENTEPSNSTKPVLPAVFFIGFKIIKYRIIRDNYGGFEVQKWKWYFPFWLQLDYVNTNLSVEQAIRRIENDMIVVVAS